MRLAGELLLLVSIAIVVSVAILHKVAVNGVIGSGGQPDAVSLARLMQLPFQGVLIASPCVLLGVVLLGAAWLKRTRTPPKATARPSAGV